MVRTVKRETVNSPSNGMKTRNNGAAAAAGSSSSNGNNGSVEEESVIGRRVLRSHYLNFKSRISGTLIHYFLIFRFRYFLCVIKCSVVVVVVVSAFFFSSVCCVFLFFSILYYFVVVVAVAVSFMYLFCFKLFVFKPR